MKLTNKELNKLGGLACTISQHLRDLFTKTFNNHPLIFDVIINDNVSIEYSPRRGDRGPGIYKVYLSIQIIWKEDNYWIEPLDFCFLIDEEGEMSLKACRCKHIPTKERFVAIARETYWWGDFQGWWT